MRHETLVGDIRLQQNRKQSVHSAELLQLLSTGSNCQQLKFLTFRCISGENTRLARCSLVGSKIFTLRLME